MGLLAFNPQKTKVALKVSLNRLHLHSQKKTSQNQSSRREIADLLSRSKIESARIKVENVIREDYYVEALELVEIYIDTLISRFGLLELSKECDPGVLEAVVTLIYAAPRIEVKELLQVRDQLIAKFGKEFAIAAVSNTQGLVNSRVVTKLSIGMPDPELVNMYLEAIAEAHNVEWSASPPKEQAEHTAKTTLEPSEPVEASEAAPLEKSPEYTSTTTLKTKDEPANFDDLQARFEKLKQKK